MEGDEMGRNLEGRIAALEEGTPGGYCTYNCDDNVVIDSELPAGEWFSASLNLLRNGSQEQKATLKSQLRRSVQRLRSSS